MASSSKSSKQAKNSSQSRSCIRYEILLPTNDNNGNPIPQKNFILVGSEIVNNLGDYTIDSNFYIGTWSGKDGKLTTDETIKVIIDIPESSRKTTNIVLLEYKEKLKKRFKQEEIYIVSYQIDVL